MGDLPVFTVRLFPEIYFLKNHEKSGFDGNGENVLAKFPLN